MKIILTEIQLDKLLTEEPVLLHPVGAMTKVNSRFQKSRCLPGQSCRKHSGVDYKAIVGTPMISIADGTVKYSKVSGKCGLGISIKHDNGYTTLYCHLSQSNVSKGDRVVKGQEIGLSGGKKGDRNSGNSLGPHLHFQLKFKGKWIDPENYLDKSNIMVDKTDEEITKSLPDGALSIGDGHKSRSGMSINVEEMQSDLMRRNYVLPKFGVDGKFGPETLKSVNLFQQDHGFEVGDVVTQEMLTAMKDETKVNKKPQLNDKNKEEEVEKEIDKTDDNETLDV